MRDKKVAERMLALEKMRRDFVANVSHELRTPLTVIHGYLEALLDQIENGSKQQKIIFEQMYQQTMRMENIIEDLLLLSHLETENDHGRVHQKVNIPRLIKAICKEAKILSGESNHNFHLSVDNKLYISGDEKELNSLISNLIFNAVKYTPAGGDIFVDWFVDADHIYLKVHDTGIGIAKKHIPRLTERFYRVDKARSRASGGTGLGLAIVKHVLNRHDAQLIIESKLNHGSTFTCVFNLTENPQSAGKKETKHVKKITQ